MYTESELKKLRLSELRSILYYEFSTLEFIRTRTLAIRIILRLQEAESLRRLEPPKFE